MHQVRGPEREQREGGGGGSVLSAGQSLRVRRDELKIVRVGRSLIYITLWCDRIGLSQRYRHASGRRGVSIDTREFVVKRHKRELLWMCQWQLRSS